MNAKKAQAWGFDVIIATGIFVFGITIFFLYTINYPRGENQKIEDLLYEGNSIAEDIISKGSPENWTIDTVSKIGIMGDKAINQSKLEQFYQMALTDYGRTKSLFRTKYNYFVNASSSLEISGSNIEGIGNKPVNTINSIKISRVTLYKNKPITIEVQIWEWEE